MGKKKQYLKAAIVTWCYNNGKTNYGQILQCYAMQAILKKFGYKTKVIRYRKRNSSELICLNNKPKWFIDIYELWYRLVNVENRIDGRIIRFIGFIKKEIILSNQCYTKKQLEKECSDCEVLVCGSDQIWNPEWFQDIYALNFGKSSQKRIAYAPSGVIVENESNEKVYKMLGKYLDKFDLVTVRERTSVDILKKYTKKKIVDVLDPTLLLEQEEWNRVATKKVTEKPYVFCYFLGKLRTHKILLKNIMKRYNATKILFLVSGFYKNENDLESGGYFYPVKNAGPVQFLALIRDACAVCTDSFHGVAFSVVYKKPFFIFERSSEQANLHANFVRQIDLMEKIGVKKDRFIRCVRDINKAEEIDYEKLLLEHYKEEAILLIKSVL